MTDHGLKMTRLSAQTKRSSDERHLKPGDLLIIPLDQAGAALAVVTHIDNDIA